MTPEEKIEDIQDIPQVAPEGLPMPSKDELEKLKGIANTYAASGMLVRDCRTAEAAFLKMLFGRELGFGPATSLFTLEWVENRLTLPASLQVASIRQRGLGKVELVESTRDQAVVRITKKGWPKNRTETVSFTRDDAEKAHLLDKSNYRKWPQSMFAHRAYSIACKLYFQEAFYGICSADELGVETDETGKALDLSFDPVPKPWEIADGLTKGKDAEARNAPEAAQTTDQGDGKESAGGEAGDHGEAGRAGPDHAGDGGVSASGAGRTPDVPQNSSQNERAERAKAFVRILRISQERWTGIIQRYGKQSFTELSDTDADHLLTTLSRIKHIRMLKNHMGMSVDRWKEALTARGVTDDLDLTPKQVCEMFCKLCDHVTPFDLNRLGVPLEEQARAFDEIGEPKKS